MSRAIKILLGVVVLAAAVAGGAYLGRASKTDVVITSTSGGAQYSGGFKAEGAAAEKAKAAAAVRWCAHAAAHAASAGGKPWKYILVPHDEVRESEKLSAYLRFEQRA